MSLQKLIIVRVNNYRINMIIPLGIQKSFNEYLIE